MSTFQEKVAAFVRKIPRGKVVSYGQVAVSLGAPRAAREVGWALRNLGQSAVPWWRVINNEGRISIRGNISATAEQQKALLEAEGIAVSEQFILDINQHRWQP